MTYKLGSLFDGSGGFPLAGALCGVIPVWAAEIEPYPIAVTRSRFPNMKHLGDISKIHGAAIEPVDIITFGSPCQDLSVAGKRAGLKHEANGDEETTRSGLFMEAVRIIKEMRNATNGKYPRFAIWENVPGAFSSNSGEDFRIVCEELIKIVEPSASMPPVPQKGWNYSDSYIGDGWSLAYRVFDAQYWGVPQRRRRIYLVTDFGGERAREVLFEREGLRGYFATGKTPWQTTPSDAESRVGADDRARTGNGGLDALVTSAALTFILDNIGGQAEYGKASPVNGTLRAGTQGAIAYSFDSLASNSMKSKNPYSGCREVKVAKTLDTTDPNPCKNQGGIAVVEPAKVSIGLNGETQTSPTLIARMSSAVGTTQDGLILCEEVTPIHDQATRFSGKRGDKADGKGNGLGVGEPGNPMNTLTQGDRHAVAYGLDRASFNQGQNAKYDFLIQEEQQPTLTARGPGAVCCSNYIVRRLTPTECARLQGFADWWGAVEKKKSLTDEECRFWNEVRNTHALINGRKTQDYTGKQMLTWYNKLWTDSAEYKMWGNGISLPTALYCLQGIVEALETVGSDSNNAEVTATEELDNDDWMN